MSKIDFDWEMDQFIVLYLRAISVSDMRNTEYQIVAALFSAVKALIDCKPEDRKEIAVDWVGRSLRQARLPDIDESDETVRPIDHVAVAAGKVLAERISDSRVQQTLAENRLFDAIARLNALRDERR